MNKKDDQIYQLKEIFTPSRPASYTYIERPNVNRRLDRAFNTPGKQIILYGHSGAGKTTILTNKLRNEDIKHITTRCVNGMTLNDIVIDGFNQLEIFFRSSGEEAENAKLGGTLSASYFGIKASLSGEHGAETKFIAKRAVELPITPQNLAKFMGASGNCWVIEDFHKIDENEKVLMAQIMKVFMDSSIDYENLKIIAIGAVNSAREVVQYDPEMKNRISEIEVPLMNAPELRNIIEIGEKLLNVKIPDSIIKKMVAYSSGLAAVTHQLAYLLCEANKINKTYSSIKAFEINPNTFDIALDEYIAENSDTLKSVFEVSTRIYNQRKSENPTDIIKAILLTNKENVSINDIIENIKISNKTYKGNNLRKYVHELTTPSRSEILRYNEDSMTYYFSNPFIKAYFQCLLRSDSTNIQYNAKYLLKEFRNTLNKELEIARLSFLKDFDDYN